MKKGKIIVFDKKSDLSCEKYHKFGRKLLKGSSLVEVLVAMIIIMSSLAAGVILYGKIHKSSLIRMKITANLHVEKIMTETRASKEFVDKEFTIDNIIIQREFIPYEEYENLQVMQVKAINKEGKVLLEKKEIVLLETGSNETKKFEN